VETVKLVKVQEVILAVENVRLFPFSLMALPPVALEFLNSLPDRVNVKLFDEDEVTSMSEEFELAELPENSQLLTV